MAVNRNNTYRNVNFTLSYDVVENTLLERIYTPGWFLGKAHAKTILKTLPTYETHVLVELRGSDLEYTMDNSEEYVNGVVSTGNMDCKTRYAIYTTHFGEMWDGDEQINWWDLYFYAN